MLDVPQGTRNASDDDLKWIADLSRGERGPYHTLSNVVMALTRSPHLIGLVGYKEFAYRVEILRKPPLAFATSAEMLGPFPRPLTDQDTSAIQAFIQHNMPLRPSEPVMSQALDLAAHSARFHPVRSWLAGLRWDGKPRLATWLAITFGVAADEYHEAIGTKFLVAAVRLIRVPGSLFRAMLVLEGLQNLGKSRCVLALFGPDWFGENLGAIGTREAPISILGRWGMEIPELDTILRSNSHEVVKAFLSTRVDSYREVHGRRVVDRPRQCVFIGTTNATDWLRDPTGNTRFWPVACQRAEADWVAENREQLWAEAAELETDPDFRVWLDEEQLVARAAEHQSVRLPEDMWTDRVRDYCSARSEVRVVDVVAQIGLPVDKQDRRAEMRIAAILMGDGWFKHYAWQDGRSLRIWKRRMIV